MADGLLDNHKRVLEVRLVPGTSLFEIAFKGGGACPHPLKGRYTNELSAKRAIEQYAQSRRQSVSQ
jgi:hypothetical protein